MSFTPPARRWRHRKRRVWLAPNQSGNCFAAGNGRKLSVSVLRPAAIFCCFASRALRAYTLSGSGGGERSGVTAWFSAPGSKSSEVRPRISDRGMHGAPSKMRCNGVTNAKTTKRATVCCDRLLLAHSTNFIVLTFATVSHKCFSW